MTRAQLFGVLLAVFSYLGTAQATPLFNNSGLGPPTVTFNPPPVLSQGSEVTNQYDGFGVNFSDFFYNTQPVLFPTESLANFDSVFVTRNTNGSASILFSRVLHAVAFALQGGPGDVTISALLNDNAVESFTREIRQSVLPDTTQANNFYGFTNISFNEIKISPPDGFNLFQLDNLQFSRVPAPGTLALLGLGLAALFFGKRRADTNGVHPPMDND